MSNFVFPVAALGAYVDKRAPYDDAEVDTAPGGQELTTTWWFADRVRYVVRCEVMRSDARSDYQQLQSFFERHLAMLDSFLLQDPEDSSVIDDGFGVGTGSATAFQLQRSLQGSTYDGIGGPWTQTTKPRTNLVLWSQDLTNAAWTLFAAGVSTAPAPAPDGSYTAQFLAEDTTNAAHAVETGAIGYALGQTYTHSVFVKMNAGAVRTTFGFGVYGQPTTADGLNAIGCNFDLAAGAPIVIAGQSPLNCTPTMTSCGNGWYRCAITFTYLGSSLSNPNGLIVFLNGPVGYVGDGVSGLFVWGVQVEQQPGATPYLATTTVPVTSAPAYWTAAAGSYAGGFRPVYDLNGPALLTLEQDGLGKRPLSAWSRTNLALQSEAVDNASWTKAANAAVTANAVAAPNGAVTADKLKENNTTSAEYYAEQAVVIAAGFYQASCVYLKAAERTWAFVGVVLRDAVSVQGAFFDLANGAVGSLIGTSTTASMVQCLDVNGAPTGWWRCSVVLPVGAGASNPRLRVQPCSANGVRLYTGVIGNGVYVWGLQAEQAFQSGDYIATTTATVSRTDYVLGAFGQVTMTQAPVAGAALAWSGNYYIRCRWDDVKGLSWQRIVKNMWSAEVNLISVKPSP